MATMATTVICPQIQFGRTHIIPLQMVLASTKILDSSITTFSSWERPNQRLLLSSGRKLRDLSLTTFAVGSGLEASITDQKKKNDISLDNVKVAVESRDDEKIHVRVDLTAEETQKAFDEVLTNLARTAPPIPGFRRMKGGKTSNVPKSFLLQILGKDRVTKFLIQEVVSTTIGDYVKKEKLKVKSQFKTLQSAEELESAFEPGSEFGFNATINFEKSDPETTEPSSS
ncbi:uncharacterized protein LOC109716583 isoform X2 [Ananas comosus]|uniref:peptidylprolyl isomerase n=1 Tax=Ananas comosus TaxID=4615 RepID=A0A6P5FW48_ANACO|nr:uncharacterized protein LOC109716583 isoform X2 [Ananas comosus]